MGRCIIHAGMARTGSRSIQHSLMDLDCAEVLYAPFDKLPGFPSHTATLRNLYTPPDDPRHIKLVQHQGYQQFKQTVALTELTMQSALALVGDRDFILSADGLMRLSLAALKAMRAALQPQFEQFSVIGYVRPPHSYIESVLQQRIRGGDIEDLDLAALWPRYAAQISRLDSVFTRDEVTLVKYDKARFANGDVVADFCGRAGVAPERIQPVRRHAPMTRLATQLLYQYAVAVKAGEAPKLGADMTVAVAERLATLDPAPFRLAPSLLEPVFEDYSEDIAFIEARTGEAFSEERVVQPGDIASLDALAEPVADAESRLAALIEADGGTFREADRDSIPALLMRLAETVQRRQAAKARRAGKIPPPIRKVRAPRRVPVGDQLAFTDMAVPKPEVLPRSALNTAPAPLLNRDKNLIAVWAPKSACTTAYVWFSHISGFSGNVRAYANWPHRHRMEQFQQSKLYFDGLLSGMPDATVLKIIREPYGRAVSIYRHALQTHFADIEMEAWSDGKIDAMRGYSFQTFLDLLETLDMRRVDVHFRPQLHPIEETRTLSRVVNISKADMFEQLNAFEEEQGWPRTDFADLSWLHDLEGKRKAKQEPMAGDALDEVPFTRAQVKELDRFPHYAQLLTPRAKRRIEAIYKVDFDAYGRYL